MADLSTLAPMRCRPRGVGKWKKRDILWSFVPLMMGMGSGEEKVTFCEDLPVTPHSPDLAETDDDEEAQTLDSVTFR